MAAMEGLIGVALVAQLPSEPAQIAFRYPRQDPGSGENQGEGAERSDDCFGIPALIFAKLMLPDKELCNRPLYLEMDAGYRETTYRDVCYPHGPLSHLHFVSFPCNVALFHQQHRQATDYLEMVQRFNVVHVLDSRLIGREDPHMGTLWEVSAHLARALVVEEARVKYLSKQLQLLARSQQPPEAANSPTASIGLASMSMTASATAAELEPPSLDKLLIDLFEGVRERGYKSLMVNGCILCHVCIFPKNEAPFKPSEDNALALLCPREQLLQELPVYGADIVADIVGAASPTVTLGELALRLGLPLSTLQRITQHLVYWKKARVVDAFQPQTRVAVQPSANLTSPDSPQATSFRAWLQEQHSPANEGLSFSEVLAAFSRGCQLREAEERLGSRGVDFGKLLEWLLAEDLLVQLAEYCHFLPSRAKPSADKKEAESGTTLHDLDELEQMQRLTVRNGISEGEFRLLRRRAADRSQLEFLCRFVVTIVRQQVRIDGARFAGLARVLDGGRQAARELIEANSDIFVRYVCRC